MSDEKIAFLAQLPIFRNLPAAAQEALQAIATEYQFQRGAIIAHENDVADGLYIVREGQLEAFILDEDEQYVKQTTYSPGDYFDDKWLFEPSTHPATIRARKAGLLIVIPNQGFLNFVKSYPSALNAIYPHLSVMGQDAIHHSRFQAYLSRGLRRRVGPTPEEAAALAAEREAELAISVGNQEAFEEFVPNTQRIRRYAKLQLLPEEVVYFESRRSTKIMGAQVAFNLSAAVILFLIPIILLGTSGVTGTIMVITGLILGSIPLINLVVRYVNWLNCYFFVTNKRIIRYENKVFRFRTNVEKIEISKVQSVNTETPSLLMRWLNIGTATITTAAQSSVIYFDFIDRPKDVEKAINHIRERNKAIYEGRHREELRKSMENLFVEPDVQEVRAQQQTIQVNSGVLRQLSELFVRSESNGSITYHKHPIALVRPLLIPLVLGFVVFLLAVALYYFYQTILLIPAVLGVIIIILLSDLAWIVWIFEDWRNDTYQLTDRYIFDIDRMPFGLRESRKQAELSKIENVSAEQEGVLPSLFNFGNVSVETAGADSNITFENVREPERIQNEIFARRERFRQKQAREEEKRQRQDYTLMIDLYHQALEQGRIPRHHPLPTIDEDDDEETPLQL